MRIKEVSRKTVERTRKDGSTASLLIVYVEKEGFSPRFGMAQLGRDIAFVRSDLPKRIKQHVEEHEIYHLLDEETWGSWWGRELRTLAIAPRDPLGFLATLLATIASKERLCFYQQRIRKGF